jgi:hypothetical protein
MPTYDIDGIEMIPQPTEHEWGYPTVLGNDGDGLPFHAKYSTLTLRVPIDLGGHHWFDDWFETSFATTHTVSCPKPGTVDDFQTYSDVYIEYVREGAVLRKTGVRGVEMLIRRVVV